MTERKARGSTKMGVTAPEHLMGAVKVARDNYLVERWWKYGQPAIDLIEATINVRNMVDADLGRVRAQVRTRVPLTDGERDALRARLAGVTGAREVIVEEHADDTLLGGFVAEIGTYLVDGSLDGQLARIGERLKHA